MTIDTVAIGRYILKRVSEEKIVEGGDIIMRSMGDYEGANMDDVSRILKNLVSAERLDELYCKDTSTTYYILCQGRPIKREDITGSFRDGHS